MNKDSLIACESPFYAKFKQKSQALQLLQKGILIVVLIYGSIRITFADNLSQEQYNRFKFSYACYIATLLICSQIPISEIRRFNLIIFIQEKLLFLLFCFLTYGKVKESETYRQLEGLPGFIALQTSLVSCYIISAKQHLINLAVTWFIYFFLIVYLRGISQTGISLVNIMLTMIVQMLSRWSSLALETNLDQIYSSLEKSQTLLKQVFNYLPEGVLICKHEGIIPNLLFWNSAFEEIVLGERSLDQEKSVTVDIMKQIKVKPTQQKVEEMDLEENLFERERINVEQAQPEYLWNVIENIQYNEVNYLKIPELKKHIEVFKLKMEHFDKTLIFLKDITAIRDKQKQRVNQQMQAVFLSSISHDLKTPINQILSTNQYLKLRNPSSNDFRIYRLQEASCNFMLSLIDDITDLSKFQLKKFTLNTVVFSIKNLLKEIQELFEIKIEEQHIKFMNIVDDDVPEHICLDRKRVKQIIMNLVSNAIKFTYKGAITLKIEIIRKIPRALIPGSRRQEQEEEKEEVFSPSPKRYLTIQVKDTGVGISKEGQKKLFKLFGMLNKTKGINPNGTGLGLVICKRLTQAMKGFMEVESQENVGSTFKASLLLQNMEEEFSLSFQRLSSRSSCKRLSTLHLEEIAPVPFLRDIKFIPHALLQDEQCQNCSKYLVIDDDSFNILAFELLIEQFYHSKIDSALSATLGIQKLEQKLISCCGKPYDYVFVDLNMPMMNGDQMMLQVKELIQSNQRDMGKYEETTFILCTAQSSQTVENFNNLGFHYFIEKPVRLDDLQDLFGI